MHRKEVPFMGHLIITEGLKPDPEKLKAVLEMPTPTDVTGIQLPVIYGLEKFHQYTFGRMVTVQSDHKPLETIVKKSQLKAPKLLQRMLLRMQMNDVKLTHRKGRNPKQSLPSGANNAF